MIVLNLCHLWHVSQVMRNGNPDTIVEVILIWSDKITYELRHNAVASYEHNIEHNGLLFEQCSKA